MFKAVIGMCRYAFSSDCIAGGKREKKKDEEEREERRRNSSKKKIAVLFLSHL